RQPAARCGHVRPDPVAQRADLFSAGHQAPGGRATGHPAAAGRLADGGTFREHFRSGPADRNGAVGVPQAMSTAVAGTEVNLLPGALWFGTGDVRLHTLLGSCVAITLWHPRYRYGGMCHFMLPGRSRSA